MHASYIYNICVFITGSLLVGEVTVSYLRLAKSLTPPVLYSRLSSLIEDMIEDGTVVPHVLSNGTEERGFKPLKTSTKPPLEQEMERDWKVKLMTLFVSGKIILHFESLLFKLIEPEAAVSWTLILQSLPLDNREPGGQEQTYDPFVL